MKKEIIKKSIKRMDLLEHLKMSLFNFNFNLIYIIHKMLALIRNNLNYLKDSIFECFFRKYNRLLVLKKMIFSSQHIIMECLSLEEENIIKYIRNPFGQKEEQNYLLLLIEFSICQIFLDYL